MPADESLKHERQLHGWSQAEVASRIGSDSKSVGRWERRRTFPSPYYRQKLVELYGKDAKVLGLIKGEEHKERGTEQHASWQEDWGEAPHIDSFYGRQKELAELEQWIISDHCRMVAVLGMGGVGKTTFATVLTTKIQHTFPFVFWRSLQHAAPIESILKSFLHFVAGHDQTNLPNDPGELIDLFINHLREYRCLFILDNFESILQVGERVGAYLPGYENYGRLLQRVGETHHQSCLILTSREKPKEFVLLEGFTSLVRALPLPGLRQTDGQMLLQNKELSGSDETWATFINHYSGNPLALKLVSEPILEVFAGDIADFLQEDKTVFGDINDLIDQSFKRLSKPEQEVLYWLAIEREVVSLHELRDDAVSSILKRTIPEALDALQRRSMIEKSAGGGFTLQPVIMEYVTERFLGQLCKEFVSETIGLVGSHLIIKALAKDYTRNSQVRLILTPLAEKLLDTLGKVGSIEKLKNILDILHKIDSTEFNYSAGNILNLLVHLQVSLRGIDFSHLTVQQAYLQDVALPEVNFAHSDLSTAVFADTFSNILCVEVSPNGKLLAAGTTTDEVRLWLTDGMKPLFILLGHTDGIRSVAFSPDSKFLVSGSEDQTIRLWDTNTGLCLNVFYGHASLVRSVAFSPIGQYLASGSEDQTIRLWDASTGFYLKTLEGHEQRVRSISFSSDGAMLASGSDDATVRLWDINTGLCVKVLQGHTNQVRSVAFTTDGMLLASGGEDQTIRLWDTNSGLCLKVLQGHSQRVWCIAFDSSGNILASGSDDQTIRLWDTHSGLCLKVLRGHTNRVWSVDFYPAGNVLVSASEDSTLRFWDTQRGQCFKLLQGYASLIKSIAFSPDGHLLVSGSEDQSIRLWNVDTGQCIRVLQGHTNRVRSVAFSPAGTTIASGSEDETVRLWEVATGNCLKTLRGHKHLVRSVTFNTAGNIIASGSHDQTVRMWNANNGQCIRVLPEHGSLIWCVAFSPDNQVIASSTDDPIIRIWDVDSGHCLKTLQGHTHRVCSLAYSPDGKLLASGSDDQTVRIWDTGTGLCLKILQGHDNWVKAVAFSSDGRLIASGSHDQMVRIWDITTGQCLKILQGHLSRVWSVTFNPDGRTIASASDDGTVKIWEIESGKCLKTLRSARPYEGMNITGAKGLSESQKVSLKLLGAIDNKESLRS